MLGLQEIQSIKTRHKYGGLSIEEQFVYYTYEDLEDIKHKFIDIGFRLNEANNLKYYEKLGYESIVNLSEHLFGFKKSTTYSLINVYQRFGNSMKILPEFDKFSQSQLTEMCSLPEYLIKHVKPDMTIQDIRDYKKAFNELTVFNEDTLKDTRKLIEDYRNNKSNNSRRPEEKNGVTSKDVDDCLKRLDNLMKPLKNKKDTKKYIFTTEKSVKEFLSDHFSWEKGECSSPYFNMSYYTFKNGKRIYYYLYRSNDKNHVDHIYGVHSDLYIDNSYSDVPCRISEEELIKYILENKNSL